MTVVFATKYNNEIWISCDTRLTIGQESKIDTALDSKILTLDNAILGFAGDVSMRNLMEYFLVKNPIKLTFESKIDVMELFLEFKKFLRKNAEYGQPDTNQPLEINSSWVLVTKSKMFEINYDGSVIEYDDFCSVGSGSTVARAVFDYITTYQPKLSIKTILERTHLLVCNQVPSCGGDQEIINATLFLDPKKEK